MVVLAPPKISSKSNKDTPPPPLEGVVRVLPPKGENEEKGEGVGGGGGGKSCRMVVSSV